MNLFQKAKLKMYQVVNDFLVENSEAVNLLPNLPAYHTQLGENIVKLQKAAANESNNWTGLSDYKQETKDALVVAALEVSSRLSSYARQNNRPELLKNTYYTESKLRYISDSDLSSSAEKLYDIAEANLEELATFGITAETQTAYKAKIDAFNKAIPMRRDSITAQVRQTKQTEQLFRDTDGVLKQIDNLIEIVRNSNANLYVGYMDARKVIEVGTESLAVNGKVFDAVSLEAISGVEIELMLLPLNGHAPVQKKSAEKGGFRIKSLQSGMYQVKAGKLGYTEKLLDIVVNSGETTDLTIALTKN
ncbi:carboxypeptidase-like regulatory domain-containing protein [Prolixibacter denitrificans]|uniref:Carboxypeptidase family protein n=1 Tax=Prolixibacter denitrificans TaxID=1541063 RepID=A0A2P8C593_9BACT|nr:carboxypeptidase-like regulatory domain-containing protein [Prolixibacter denitrificans]PSK80129.1 carboxypeptidase family protein [Prolixibacter denitrificans]GET22757.1 hypothetical protein JCM18694_30030 [Prolixibacter denitrificans]